MPLTQRFLQTLEAMEQKIIPSNLNIRDGEVKEMPTIESQTEREMMIPKSQRGVATLEDRQEEMIQMMTLMVTRMMTLQMAMATQHQAVITHIAH